jgi:predicted membrane protein
MDGRNEHSFNAKIVAGIAIIIFGILVSLSKFGLGLEINVWDCWPLILLLIGFGLLFRPRENRRYFGGILFLVFGALFLAHNLIKILNFNIVGLLLAVIVVIIGAKILTRELGRSKKSLLPQDKINLSVILGGGKFSISSKELKGGNVTAIMGGCNVNLRDADFAEESIVMDTFAIMGGIELTVPNSWEVVMQGVPFMGAMEDKTNHNTSYGDKAQKKRLIIRGTAIMGGVEIIN